MRRLAVSSVSSSVAILLKELLGLVLHLRVHSARTLGPDVKQNEAALQHIWEGPGLKQHRTDKEVPAELHTDKCMQTGGMSSWVSFLMPQINSHMHSPSMSAGHSFQITSACSAFLSTKCNSLGFLQD